MEFEQFLSQRKINRGWALLISRSQRLLADTLAGREEDVAASLNEIREENYAPQFYNNEQALRTVIKYAYIVALGQYVTVEEMPSGRGIADVVLFRALFPDFRLWLLS